MRIWFLKGAGQPEKETSDLRKFKQELLLARSSCSLLKIAFCYEKLEKAFKELSYEMGLLAKFKLSEFEIWH